MTPPKVRLKWLLEEIDRRVGESAPTLPLLSVSITDGVRQRSDTAGPTRAAAEDLSRYKVCTAGNLVINRMRAFQGALGIAPVDGVVSPDYSVLRVSTSVEQRWICYLLTSTSMVAEMSMLVRGIGGTESGKVRTPRLNVDDLHSIRVALPPAGMQRAIADFLDRETTRIDTLIEEQQRLIGLLRERRRAVSTWAVTVGVDNAALQDSGDPRIGLVPSHWTIKKVGHWLTSLDGERVPLSAEERGDMQGEYEYYGASGVIDHIDRFIFSEPLVLVSEDGANLLARSSAIAFPAKGSYWVNNHAHVLRPKSGDVDFWAERLEALDVAPYVSGSAQPKLTASALSELRVSAPVDVDEQRRIAAFLAEKTSKIDTLIAETEKFIELARERRAALITAAVTGQIDVRDEVA